MIERGWIQMERIYRICIFLMLGWAFSRAQEDRDRPIAELSGGSIRTEFSVSGSGGVWGWSAGMFDALRGNPAALGLLDKRSVVLEWVPGVLQNLQKWTDVDGRIRDEVDGLIRDYGTSESRVRYPSLIPELGFRSNLTEFGAVLPFRVSGRRFGIGFGISSPFVLDVRFVGTGMEAGMDTEREIQGELKRVRMRTRAGLDFGLQLRMNRFRFGAGADIGKGLSAGVSAVRSHVQSSANVRVRLDGVVEISGTEYVYNDPDDPRIDFRAGEQNDINQAFDADYSGSAWGFRFGAVQRLSGSVRLGLAVDLPSSIRLHGTDSLVSNRIPFIRIGGGKGGGSVDDMIDASRIDLAQLTKTERVLKKNQYDPSLLLPKAIGVGIQWQRGAVRIALGYTKYSGVLGAVSGGKEKGVRLIQGMCLEADLKYVFFVGSADVAETSGSGGREFLIPGVHIGFRIPLAASFRVEGTIGAEPIPALRLAGRYEF